MNDISEKIQELLSDEESMKKIQQLYQMISQESSNDKQPSHEECDDGCYENSDSSCFTDDSQCEDMNFGFDFDMLFKLQELFGNTGENKNTALITALKPYLSVEKQEKADKAIKIMNMLDAVEILKDSGILGDIF